MYTKAHYFPSQARNLWRLGLLRKESKLKKKKKHKAKLLCQIFLLILSILVKSSNSFLIAKSILIILHLCCTSKNVLFVFRFHVSFITDEVQHISMFTNSFSAMQSACHGFSSLIRGLLVYILLSFMCF